MSVPDPVTIAVTGGLVLSGANQVAKQAQDFLAAAMGHPGESIGTVMGNALHERIQNAEGILCRSQLILLNIGVTAKTIPLTILQPALEAASLQDDEYLKEMWANLLANAADPRQPPIELTFTRMLSELSSREVKFLDLTYKSGQGTFQASLAGWHQKYLASKMLPDVIPHFSGPPVMNAEQETEFAIIMDILLGLRIFAENNGQTADGPYRFRPLGIAFVRACQPPRK